MSTSKLIDSQHLPILTPLTLIRYSIFPHGARRKIPRLYCVWL
jgi:hypothetical protein